MKTRRAASRQWCPKCRMVRELRFDFHSRASQYELLWYRCQVCSWRAWKLSIRPSAYMVEHERKRRGVREG